VVRAEGIEPPTSTV